MYINFVKSGKFTQFRNQDGQGQGKGEETTTCSLLDHLRYSFKKCILKRDLKT